MKQQNGLAKIVNKATVTKYCFAYGDAVIVPIEVLDISKQEQEKGIKQEHYFPGGYISPLGGIFSSYKAFHDYTQ